MKIIKLIILLVFSLSLFGQFSNTTHQNINFDINKQLVNDTNNTVSFGDKSKETIEKLFKYFPLPFSGYSTETNVIFGITKYNAFKFKSSILSDSLIQPSSALIYAYYTLNHQYKIFLNTDLMYKDNRFNTKLDVLFLKYPSLYFKIGNKTDNEGYLLDYENFLFSPEHYYNFYKNVYIGAKYEFNNYLIVDAIDSIPGSSDLTSNAGIQSGVGLSLYDESRNNRIRATKGYYVNLSYKIFDESIGSKFNYSYLKIDLRKYYTPVKNLTIAAQYYSEFTSGNVPLQSMPVIGGTERMRGIYEARFRDKSMLMSQLEVRYPIFWIISGTVYGAVGQVAPKVSDITMSGFHFGYGAGLRLLIDEATSSVLRFDISFSEEGHTIFVGFNEAF